MLGSVRQRLGHDIRSVPLGFVPHQVENFVPAGVVVAEEVVLNADVPRVFRRRVVERCDVTFQDFMFVFKMCFFQFQDLIIFVENPFKPVLDTVLPHTCPCNTEKT